MGGGCLLCAKVSNHAIQRERERETDIVRTTTEYMTMAPGDDDTK